MMNELDTIIVIDVESTTWKDIPPPSQEREIIEIGICPLQVATGKRLSKRNILVKPEKSTVTDYCTKLTTLTQEQIKNLGISLKEACSTLEKEYLTKTRTWASWGKYDKNQFERECKSKNVPYPFGPNHVNIKSLFASKKGLTHEVELLEALQMLGLQFEGTYHRAVDDAYNIAHVFLKII
ncbi:MAG: exonuclease domain-containing protein [Candidatus Helarchaeota archaeon]|nr:exonuclease domain-containing protein [Candidatus Helarchaeota archaeon]